LSDTPTRLMSDASAQPIVSRALLTRFVSIVGSSIGFYLPLAVIPLLAKQSGSSGAAALPTAALLIASVVCETLTPRLLDRVGYRSALGVGLTLLGAPAVVLALTASVWLIIAVSIVRGCGFAICVVAGGAVTATLIPPTRRGEGLALVGLVGGVPALVALPAGLWIASRWGYAPVFYLAAVLTLLAVPSVSGLPRLTQSAKDRECRSVFAGIRDPALARPATIFATSTAAVGVLVTYLPLATSEQPRWVATTALLAEPGAATVARWVAGRHGDRRGHASLLTPGLLTAAAGMTCLAATGSPAAVIVGAVVFGAGFGVLQNATLVLMYHRAPLGGEDVVSAIWNATYDLGMAAGALAAGALITPLGYDTTFVLAAALMLPALATVRRDQTANTSPSHSQEITPCAT
jgi:predicted MFS family arabinose efflux permease